MDKYDKYDKNKKKYTVTSISKEIVEAKQAVVDQKQIVLAEFRELAKAYKEFDENSEKIAKYVNAEKKSFSKDDLQEFYHGLKEARQVKQKIGHAIEVFRGMDYNEEMKALMDEKEEKQKRIAQLEKELEAFKSKLNK